MKMRRILKSLTALVLTLPLSLNAAVLPTGAASVKPEQEIDNMWANFSKPLDEYKSRPLWFWNDSLNSITKKQIRDIMVNSKEKSGYFGFGILPNWIDNYMSDKYLELYGYALETAKELGMKMCLYDENGFPSGAAGGLLPQKYPGDTLKRLDKAEADARGGEKAVVKLPSGEYRTYLGAVAMNNETKEIVDISDSLVDGERIEYTPADGSWKIMAFATVKSDTDGLRGGERVDYLDKTAVDHLIAITHGAYYEKFSEYFGSVIDSAFYDEPMLYKAQGRTWTGKYNELFETRYGYNPITLYPALWYDIGEATESARNTLMGFRTDLFAENYIKNMNDWCEAHGIKLTGHMDQEENVNPVSSDGDLMKVFKYQDIPGVDEISFYDRARKAYKVISSSANNWDKGLVMTETYGAMGENMGVRTMYKDIINQFAKGINYIVPHAVWHNNKKNVENPPELSYRSAKYGAELPKYNEFISRTSSLLQDGRHVADIGVVYPINTLMGGFKFDVGDPYTGGVTPAEADYMEVGDLLSSKIRYDYTYLHPEVIAENCTVDGDTFKLNNEINYENYKVIVIPGSKTISWEALKKIKAFYDNGGKVVATTQLPYMAAEKGHNTDVVNTVCEMFGISEDQLIPKTIKANASSVFQDNPTYAPEKAFDGAASDASRWNAGDLSGGDQWLSAEFDSKVKINRVVLKENEPYRVTKFRIQYHNGAEWVDCYSGTEIGASKECTFDEIETDKIRLYVDTIKSDSVSIQEMEIYGASGVNLALPQLNTAENINEKGGSAAFLGTDYKNTLKSALDKALDNYDVEISLDKNLSGGDLTYIHKVKNNTDIYYFANSSNSTVEPEVSIRKTFTKPMAWDPHTGDRTALDFTVNNGITTVKLNIASAKSVFVIDGEPYEAVSGVVLDRSALELNIGDIAQLTAEVQSKYANNRDVVWSSSNEKVASVLNGNITALSEGTAVVRAVSAENSQMYAECTVTVHKKPVITVKTPVENITLNYGKITLNTGKSQQLIAKVSPDNAYDKTVSWRSENSSVAVVNSAGKITAKGAGKTRVYATAGTKSAVVTVTVKPKKVTKIKVSVKKKKATVKFKAVNGVKRYSVVIYKGKKKIKTATANKKARVTVNKKLKPAKYTLKIRYKKSGVYSDWASKKFKVKK